MTDTREVLGDLLQTARRDLAEAERAANQAQARVERLHAKIKGLELALSDIETERQPAHPAIQVASAPSRNGSAIPWPNLNRTQAILAVMKREDRPMGPAEISRLLKAEGRDGDEPYLISSTLDHLKSQHKVLTIERGKWVLADRSFPTDDRKGDLLGIPAAEQSEGGGS